MALTFKNTRLSKRTIEESLDWMSGADDCIYLKAGETFTGNIVGIVIDTAGTLTALVANDTAATDIITGTGQGYKNINGVTIGSGIVITAGKYDKGSNFTTVTSGTATAMVYYKYTIS